MTAIEAREPARTSADAQSAGSRQTAPDLTDVFLPAVGRLCIAGAIGISCAVAYSKGWNPGISIAALFLLWQFLPPPVISDRRARPSEGRRTVSPPPTPEDYMPGGGW